MKMNRFITAITLSIILASCNLNEKKDDMLIASIRKALNSPAILPIADEIELSEYIPLEITNDDASLVDGVVDFAITSKYIYVLVGKEARIVLFDRQGRFLRTFLQQGQGPNDFRGMIGFIQANEESNRFYVIGDKIGVYTLDGDFVEDLPINHPIIYAHHLGDERIGAISAPLIPFQSGSFGIGVFHEDGKAIMTKNDFNSPLVSKENSGFTFGVMGSPSDGVKQSVLFKMASNDTIFRLTADTIQSAFVAGLDNSDEEVIRGLDIRNFKQFPANDDIFITDIFETSQHYYLRMMLNERYYVASIDKHSGKTIVEKCTTPEMSAYNLADINMQLGMIGSKGYNQFPIWGRTTGNNLVQVVTPYEIEVFKEQTEIVIPQELQKNDVNGNPIFIIYNLINYY